MTNGEGNVAYGSINTSTCGKIIQCGYTLAVGAEINSCCGGQPFLKLPLVVYNPIKENSVGWEKPDRWEPQIMDCYVANFVPANEAPAKIDQPDVPGDLFGPPSR